MTTAPVDHDSKPQQGSSGASRSFVRHSPHGSLFAHYGVLLAFALTVLVFGLLKPEQFLTVENLKSIITIAAPLLIVSVGLTVALVMQDFDLSLGAMIGLAGAITVVLTTQGTHYIAAIGIAFLFAAGVGLVNGFLTAYLGGSSFVITLAMTTVLTGVEFLFTDGRSFSAGIDQGYLDLAQTRLLFDLNTQVFVAAAVIVLVWVLLNRTETGRYMYAIGGNAEAARLAGVRIRELRTLGFVVVALCAAIAGILITSQGGASTPQQGVSYLLPAFAGAFLGSAVFRPGQFNVPGTVVGVLFLGVIQTGLTILSLSTAIVNIVQGGILIAAILLSHIGGRSR